MSGILFEEVYGLHLEDNNEAVVYIGDSPNDEPMFSYFTNAVGVANIRRFEGKMAHLPAWITNREGGYGFAEMVDALLKDD